jgi:hypothetical protein
MYRCMHHGQAVPWLHTLVQTYRKDCIIKQLVTLSVFATCWLVLNKLVLAFNMRWCSFGGIYEAFEAIHFLVFLLKIVGQIVYIRPLLLHRMLVNKCNSRYSATAKFVSMAASTVIFAPFYYFVQKIGLLICILYIQPERTCYNEHWYS